MIRLTESCLKLTYYSNYSTINICVLIRIYNFSVSFCHFRYNECKEKLIPYLKKCGFNPKTDLVFLPVSGLTGTFLRDVPPESVCSFYR